MSGPVWRQLRAVLVLLHLTAIVLLASPSPGAGMRRSAWKDPTVQSEFSAWTARFNAMGWQIDQHTLEDELWAFATAWERRRAVVVGPFETYARHAGAGQSWRMFVAPHRFPTALHIDVQEDGVWRTVYQERSPEHTWLGPYLDHDRFRSAIFRFGWSHYVRSYQDFADWVAVQAARDFPNASAVRCRMYKVRSPSPAEVRERREPEGKFQQERVVELAPLREGTP